MPLTKELVASVRSRVADNPAILTSQLAAELGTSEPEVITALPLHMRVKARTEDFENIWQAIKNWKNISVHQGNGAEKKYFCPVNSSSFFEDAAFTGTTELNPADVGYIWFVSKPLHDTESHSVQFFGKNGQHMLSVYLGYNCRCDSNDLENFEEMKKTFGVKPVPHNRCKGCKNCTCGGKGHEHGHKHH